MKENTSRVIILDRDGIINQDSVHYIKSVDEFIFLPDSAWAVAALSSAGFKVGVATNQSGIARGYYDHATLQQIHAKMLAGISEHGGRVDEIEYCPHAPQDACACRKPEPGMLLSLASKFKVEPAELVFIGDKITDIKAAEAVGARPMLVYSQMTDQDALAAYPSLLKFVSLKECVDHLLKEY